MKAAFDSIPINLLLAKLKKLGFGGYLLDWLGSYLSGRSYKVRVCDSFTETFVGLPGVPRRSMLSPLFFVLFVNDCLSVLPQNNCLLYADDVKIFLPVASSHDCNVLQHVLDKFSDCYGLNGLRLCPQKCSVISFGRSSHKVLWNYYICGSQLARVSSLKVLGAWLDEKLVYGWSPPGITAMARLEKV